MPLEGHRLIIEPKFPRGKELAEVLQKAESPDPEDQGITVRNTFWSTRWRATVFVYEKDGRVRKAIAPAFHHLSHDLRTLGASLVWGIEQESNALQLLGTLIRHHQFKQYLLTGMFMETSKRSGLTYIFRKLKPTVVIDTRGDPDGECRILCTLCMHPIAYYEGSWAGAMCPTDDVVAHLVLMRADEHMYWRRSNQCQPNRPEAGL